MAEHSNSLLTEVDAAVRSMTGQGAGHAEGDLGTVSVELRAVNQRGLRLVSRLNELLVPLEGRFEQLIRSRVKRGSLQGAVRFVPAAAILPGVINAAAVTAYANQLRQIRDSLGLSDTIDLTGLLQLPGAITGADSPSLDTDEIWPLLEAATEAALENLDRMRASEGAAMAVQLRIDAGMISEQLSQISELAPCVVSQYRERLENRINRLLDERGMEISPLDLLREVQLFADRCDISEEITRLSTHLHLFSDTLGGSEASGRKLDFIIQEMFRETNTIGSKAGDAQIGSSVVEIKCALERMRELVQNLE
jgi:uncharacterized protein (TIGR00255 family)